MANVWGWLPKIFFGERKTEEEVLLAKVEAFFAFSIFLAVLIEGIGALASTSPSVAWRYLVLNLILGGAAGLSGGLLGFIFGVPKAVASPSNDDKTPNSRQIVAVNTNLEQISDWLTKVLVGASLTSLIAIPGFLAKLARFLDAHGYSELPGQSTLAIFIIIYFMTLGFFWGYIETRTSFTRIFMSAAAGQYLDVATLQSIRAAGTEPGTEPIPDDAVILKMDIAQLTTAALLDARGGAETRAGNWGGAINAYQLALAKDPGNSRILSKLSLVLANAGRTQEAERIIQDAQQAARRAGNTTALNQLEVNRVFAALYTPGGYTEALALGEPLLATDQGANAWLHLYLACAYGQRAVILKGQDKPFDGDRANALNRLNDMKRLKPALVRIAASLWRPDQYGGSPSENDLEVFRDDPDFVAFFQGGGA